MALPVNPSKFGSTPQNNNPTFENEALPEIEDFSLPLPDLNDISLPLPDSNLNNFGTTHQNLNSFDNEMPDFGNNNFGNDYGQSSHSTNAGSGSIAEDSYDSQVAPSYTQDEAASGPESAMSGGNNVDLNVVQANSDNGSNSGIVKCPKCGSSDIQFSIKSQSLMCSSCRNTWQASAVEEYSTRLDELQGMTVTQRANTVTDDNATTTLKCTACGSEVVINTDMSVQARCHWCRNFLSADTKIQNGATPDAVVPFALEKATAVEKIREFVEKRKFFANPTFKQEFEPENVVGVYLPYFIFDGRASSSLIGEGEVQTRTYTKKVGDKQERFYDADLYAVDRQFEMTVDDMLIESSGDRADMSNNKKTNNTINAILPFDVKKAVEYNPNYLRDFTSERRDVNAEDLDAKVQDMLLSISRTKVSDMVNKYDRKVRWDYEKSELHGSHWSTVYLPVWLYSYYDKKKDLKHYVAVNGQNGNVMGSVPIYQRKLILTSGAMSVAGTFLAIILAIFI